MSRVSRSGVALTAIALLAGCATRQPVLYRNAAYTQQGPAAAEQNVAECLDQGEEYGAPNPAPGIARDTAIGSVVGAAGGAVGGAIWGSPGIGAASGAAGGAASALLYRLLQPREPAPAFQAGVSRCLQDRGYEVLAWQ